MTTALRRIASGSFAMWSRMGVNVCVQVALVPLFLTYWSARTYGAWLALQAAYALITLIDAAHQAFLENEFLTCGTHDRARLRLALYSALPISLLLGATQIALLLCLYKVGAFGFITGLGDLASRDTQVQAFWALLSWLMAYLFTLSPSGLLGRALSALGYFSRFAWWGLLFVISSTIVPALVLLRGGDLLEVGIAQAVVTLVYHVPWFWDAANILRRENLLPTTPSKRIALANLKGAAYLLFKSLLELSRQQGFRIVLTPLVGLQALAEFSTQRTVANVALQGLNGVYGPLMPELMRYVRRRDQSKLEGAFAVLWGLLMAILCPLVLVLQVVMPVIYPIWTRGRFVFDGVLLCMISASIVAYMLALPAMAICTGNNLVKVQLRIAAAAALVLFSTLPISVHYMGLRGAGLSLLIAETVALAGYVWQAARWLNSTGLRWPRRSFRVGANASVSAVVGMMLIALIPQLSVPLCSAFILVSMWMLLISWRSLPDSIKHNVLGQIHDRSRSIREWY
jgi:O-antigen/teichoic acid export membrane protein